MTFTPMLIVWIVVAIVLAIEVGILLFGRPPDMTMQDFVLVKPFTLFAANVFTLGLFLGFLVTLFSSPTLETWWWALAVRVTWTLGGGILMALAMFIEARTKDALEGPAWAAIGAFLALGGWLSFNSTLDLIEGPLWLRGTASLDVKRTDSGRGGGGIWATLRLRSAQGPVEQIELGGWSASQAEVQLGGFQPGQELRIVVLRHTGSVIDVRTDPAR